MTKRAPEASSGSGPAAASNPVDLVAVHGAVVGGEALWKLLGYRTGDAFRKAAQRGNLPVQTFTLPHRRGRFAKTADIAWWLASLTPSLAPTGGAIA